MFQKTLNSKSSEGGDQRVRIRPDEKPEAPQDKRFRGSNIKLSARGDKKQHRKGKRKSSRR